jgi:DNA-binding transcriptional ArsR family regulator
MELKAAVNVLSALAQPTRLQVFRMLVQGEPEGLAAGEIAQRLGVPHNTLSTHLAILARCDLISVRRNSRRLIYCVEWKSIREVLLYLLRDCCNGSPKLCGPLVESLSTCRQTLGESDG